MSTTDPRDDMPEDSALWVQLLEDAKRINFELYGALKYFRCTGLRIKQEGGRYTLRPTVDKKLGYFTDSDYARDKQQWLVLWTMEIIGLLDGLQKGRTA
jgi:hypothetical protein